MSEESTADIKFSKQFSANLVTNIISLILSTLVGLLLIPYFIDTLGEAAYGLVPLATSVTTYVTLLIDFLLCGDPALALTVITLLICIQLLQRKEDRKSIRTCIPVWIEKKIPIWLF